MKAIILAGGLGTRLGKYTKDMPKCMLDLFGKSLIQRQIDTYKECGIEDIIVVRKHLAEKINLSGVKYVNEKDYDTHMVVGLFQAREEFNDDILISYGDVLFEKKTLEKLVNFKGEVGIVADTEWKDYWNFRIGDWRKDSESFLIGKNDKIISLGISNPSEDKMNARYVGMIKFSKSALPKINEIYDNAARAYWEKPWHQSKSFKKAYMTDFMQELIDKGIDVRAVKIKKGWLEFDTIEDYERICDLKTRGKLNKFFNL